VSDGFFVKMEKFCRLHNKGRKIYISPAYFHSHLNIDKKCKEKGLFELERNSKFNFSIDHHLDKTGNKSFLALLQQPMFLHSDGTTVQTTSFLFYPIV